jgi:hypothetical protein
VTDGWYKRLVKTSIANLVAVFLLMCFASAGVGLGAVCSTRSDEPFGDCAGLCLDCSCCPNSASTSSETGSVLSGLVFLKPAFQTVVSRPADVPPAEILHIPKPALS